MPRRLPHLEELERLEAIERLSAEYAEEDAQAEAAVDMSWLTENSGGHMSETEKDWRPENA